MSKRFDQIIARADNPLGASLLFVLAWIAGVDGHYDQAEAAHLGGVSDELAHQREATLDLVRLAVQGNPEDVAKALLCLGRTPNRSREHAIELCILMALADKRLMPSESHSLRLVADALHLNEIGLDRVFRRVTGDPLPAASDPSDVEWWRARSGPSGGGNRQGSHGTRSDRSSQDADQESKSDAKPGDDRSYLEALATLGLQAGVSDAEIRKAYRRLAQIHHPDKFAPLGQEAIDVADITFRRINAAYERLCN